MADETMAKLAENELIVGVKDATADLARPQGFKILLEKILSSFRRRRNSSAYLAAGGHGCISVTANSS